MELGNLPQAPPPNPVESHPASRGKESGGSELARQGPSVADPTVRDKSDQRTEQETEKRAEQGTEQRTEEHTEQRTDKRTEKELIESRPSEADQVRPLPAPLDLSLPPMVRTKSEAIGEATDLPTPMLQVPPSAQTGGPIVQFTLLLASTGTRHPFQLNEKYLTKRSVSAKTEDGKFDPSAISVYTLKELILKDWRDDWDQKPVSPSAIRLIYFGQLLADNVSLKECKLQMGGSSNVVHISIKPQEVIDDEEAGKGKHSISRDRDPSERAAGCRCVIL